MKHQETLARLLKGAYDLHMHAAPSPFNRALDDYGLLQEASAAGMGGIMLKSHYESTAARAQLVNAHGGCSAKAFGGIVLNWPVGGLNPYAAENALIRDARIVWMPTRDSANSLLSGNMPGDFFDRPGLTLVDKEGALKPEVIEILQIAKKYNATVATGHISPEESILLCRTGAGMGVRMVLTHPEFERTIIGPEIQKELADLGVYIEKCWYNIAEGACTAAEMADHIRQVGCGSCFMVTDRGQNGREHPVEGMKLFLSAMLDEGFTEEELYTMTHTVPARVLGLD